MIDSGIEYPKPLPKLNLENVSNEMGFTPLEIVALQNIWRLFKKRFKYHSMQIFLAYEILSCQPKWNLFSTFSFYCSFFNQNHKLIERFRLPSGKFQLNYLCQHSEKMLLLYENVIDKCLDNMANFHGMMADVTVSHRHYGVKYEDINVSRPTNCNWFKRWNNIFSYFSI